MSPQRKTATRSSGRRRRLWRAGVALALVTLGGCNSRGAGSLGPCTVTHYVMEDRGGLPRVIGGGVDCLMSEVLPAEGLITHCAQLADRGRTLVSTRLDYDGVTREICGIRQLPTTSDASAPPAGEGWYYDDFSSTTERLCGDRDPSNGAQGQRLVFTPGAASPPGALVGFSCIRRILGHASDVIGPGTPCGPPWGIYCADSARPDLYCDERSRACVVGCETDGDCRDSGLGGGRCVDDLDMSCGGAAGSRCHCINPVCDSSP